MHSLHLSWTPSKLPSPLSCGSMGLSTTLGSSSYVTRCFPALLPVMLEVNLKFRTQAWQIAFGKGSLLCCAYLSSGRFIVHRVFCVCVCVCLYVAVHQHMMWEVNWVETAVKFLNPFFSLTSSHKLPPYGKQPFHILQNICTQKRQNGMGIAVAIIPS